MKPARPCRPSRLSVICEIAPPVLRRLRVLVVSLKHQREIKHRIGVVWRGSHCVIAVEKLPSRDAFRNKKAGTMTGW